jgi:hypothetical protein
MKYSLIILFCALIGSVQAQEYVFDPEYFYSVEANQAVRMSAEDTHQEYLKKINNNLNDINLNVGSVVTAQTIIYNSLANDNSALKDGLEVKYMATLTADMIKQLDACLTLAKSEPYLLLFATNFEQQMQIRSLALVTEVSNYVLKSGDNVLADYNGRDQLLKKITQTLQILDGLAYGAWRAMFWAQQRGLLASINPWQAYINKDKFFVQQIIGKAKYLQQNP